MKQNKNNGRMTIICILCLFINSCSINNSVLIPKTKTTINTEIVLSALEPLPEVWNNTLPSFEPEDFAFLRHAFQEQTIYIIVFLKDTYKIKKKLFFDLEILDPENNNYYQSVGISAYQHAKDHGWLISNKTLSVAISSKSFAGMYRFKLTVYTKDFDVYTSKEKQLKILPYERNNSFYDDTDLSKWYYNYFKDPQVDYAVSAFLYILEKFKPLPPNKILKPLSFFKSIFENNKFLLPHLAKIYPMASSWQKYYILIMLNILDYQDREFYQNLSDIDKQLLTKSIDFPYWEINPYVKIEQPIQLDMLWHEYFASGSIKPIKLIIESTNSYDKSIKEQYKDHSLMIISPAIWSLEGRIKTDPLVMRYSNYLNKYGNLQQGAKKELELILKGILK